MYAAVIKFDSLADAYRPAANDDCFFFSFPFIILTLGLFLLVINAFLLQFAAVLVSGFTIDGFWWAVAGSVVISAISWLLGSLFNL